MGERRTFNTDLSRYSSAGYGVLHSDVQDLTPGEMIAVTDEGADVISAEVVEVGAGGSDNPHPLGPNHREGLTRPPLALSSRQVMTPAGPDLSRLARRCDRHWGAV